ncbi:hypothetical protein GGI42DRAFT_336655 [Trichoderma sp. SZMC 28013]
MPTFRADQGTVNISLDVILGFLAFYLPLSLSGLLRSLIHLVDIIFWHILRNLFVARVFSLNSKNFIVISLGEIFGFRFISSSLLYSSAFLWTRVWFTAVMLALVVVTFFAVAKAFALTDTQYFRLGSLHLDLC